VGSLFVAVGKVELSKNLAPYRTDEKVFVVKHRTVANDHLFNICLMSLLYLKIASFGM
jgi:hypothetical protein